MTQPQPQPKKSDLPVRVVSAVVMVAVAGTALWSGGWPFSLFIFGVAAVALFEWCRLSLAIATSSAGRAAWIFAGAAYIGITAAVTDAVARLDDPPSPILLALLGVVIATDVGAYFTGRTLGGPKIAPAISPSKTWSGLLGGMMCAALAAALLTRWENAPVGALLAIVAQAGDFFESWMKRRAGVKDSGSFIPGHGGVLDRIDGLLPVLLFGGLLAFAIFSQVH